MTSVRERIRWRLLRPFYPALQRFRRPVVFGAIGDTEPIGRHFGFQRGKPIDRYYIDRFIEAHAERVQGDVLEVARPDYAGRHLRHGVAHILHVADETADLHADLTKAGELPNSAYDCFIMTQTLNVIFDIRAALQGTHRLLRPGGTVLATVPGIAQIARDDYERWGDYWRFTDLSVRRLFEEAGFVGIETRTYGNALSAQMFLQGLALEDVPDTKWLAEHDVEYQVIVGVAATRP